MMGSDSKSRRRSTESRLVFTFLGVVVWISTGFLVGLIAGVVSEEPELVVGHVTGQTTEIDWTGITDPGARTTEAAEFAIPDVAAAPKSVKGRSLAPTADAKMKSAPVPERTAAASPKVTPPPSRVAKVDRAVADTSAKGPTASVVAPKYSIQVGAFAQRDAAQEVAETLRGKGYAVQVLTAQDDGRWRVRVGPVAARERAEALAQRLKTDEGLPTWVLREQAS